MKKIYTLQAIIALMLLFVLPNEATAQHKFKNVNKVKSFVTRTVPSHEGVMEVIHLDSVISEQERIYYTYNEFGYLTSQKTYCLEEDTWTFQTDESESFLAEYTFDEQNRCMDYSHYVYSADGSKGTKTEQIVVTYFDDKRSEKYYDLNEDVMVLALEDEIIYDRFGNPCIMKGYAFDEETRTSRLYEYVEMRYTGCCISYEDCENGNYAIKLDDDLLEEHCYYQISWDADHNKLEGFKFERDENGNRVIYVINEYDFPESELGNIDNYWTIYEDEEDEKEEYAKAQRGAKANLEDYEEGFHTFDFTDGDWRYLGEINVHIEEIDMGDTIIYEKVIKARIFLDWLGNGSYRYTNPAYIYEFPVGIMGYRNDTDYGNVIHTGCTAFWDNETKEWRLENHYADFVKHYEKNCKIIQEAAKYTFDGETMRMKAVDGTLKTSIYSFDDAARISTIEYSTNNTTHFEYLGETNYLQKEYTTDASGNESNVTTYHYSNGKYLWPVTNATDIEEIAATDIAINGNSITANGEINVFTPSGSLVASGNGNVTVGQKGLYIVETGDKVHKILIK